MFKKIACMVAILVLAVSMSVSAEGLTPLQRKVREAFARIYAGTNNIKTAEVSVAEPTVAEPTVTTEVSEQPIQFKHFGRRTRRGYEIHPNRQQNVSTYEEQSVRPSEEQNVNVQAVAAQGDVRYNGVILAADQDNEVVAEDGEDDEFVVIHAPKKHKAKAERKPKTAAEVSSSQRTAKIDNKWSVEALGWRSKLTGHVKIAKDEDTPALDENAKIDLERDTKGIDKKTVPGFKLSYRANNRSTVDFSWVKVDQNGRLGARKEFKGKVYEANATFDINNAMFDLAWNYRLTHKVEDTGREKNYLSAILGVKASKMEFKLDGENNLHYALHESYKKTLPIPYIGLDFGSYIGDDLYFRATARYLKLNNIKHYDAKHCDYDVALSYKVSTQNRNQDLFIDLGYRQVVYDVEGEENDVELKYKGPYVGLEYRF